MTSNVSKESLFGEFNNASNDLSVILTKPYKLRRFNLVKYFDIPSTTDKSFRLTHQDKFKYVSSLKFLHMIIMLWSYISFEPHKSRNYNLLKFASNANALNPLSQTLVEAYKLRYVISYNPADATALSPTSVNLGNLVKFKWLI